MISVRFSSLLHFVSVDFSCLFAFWCVQNLYYEAHYLVFGLCVWKELCIHIEIHDKKRARTIYGMRRSSACIFVYRTYSAWATRKWNCSNGKTKISSATSATTRLQMNYTFFCLWQNVSASVCTCTKYEVMKSWKGKMTKKCTEIMSELCSKMTHIKRTQISHTHTHTLLSAAVVVEWNEKATAIAE